MTDPWKERWAMAGSVATTASAVAAAAMVFLAARDFRQPIEHRELTQWQDAFVYSTIRDKPGVSLRDLRTAYNGAAAVKRDLPASATATTALDTVLFRLLQANIVNAAGTGTEFYVATSSKTQSEAENLMLKRLREETEDRTVYERVLSLILSESGDIDLGDIRSELDDLGFHVPNRRVQAIIEQLRREGTVIRREDGILLSTYDVEIEPEPDGDSQ